MYLKGRKTNFQYLEEKEQAGVLFWSEFDVSKPPSLNKLYTLSYANAFLLT